MNEIEKSAIETIRDLKYLKWYEHAFDNGTEVLDEEQKQDIEIILNLIEKQSKEIEELKENNRKYIVQLTDEQYRKLVDIIRNDINKEWIEKINFKIEELDETKQYWNKEVIKILNDIKGY